MKKKILILLGLSLALVSCKKEVKQEVEEPKKEVKAVQKEVKVEQKKEKTEENKPSSEVVVVFEKFLGKIYSNGTETLTILSAEDLKDGSMEAEFGKLNVGDIHIYQIGSTSSGSIYKNAKIEKIDGKDVLTAEGLDRKFIIIDENTIKDEVSGSEYKEK